MKINEKYSTPLGWFRQEEIKELIKRKIIKHKENEAFSIISENVSIQKIDEKGNLSTREVCISIKYYNMKYWLQHKGMSLQEALKEFDDLHDGIDDPYLPKREGYSSYQKMFEDLNYYATAPVKQLRNEQKQQLQNTMW